MSDQQPPNWDPGEHRQPPPGGSASYGHGVPPPPPPPPPSFSTPDAKGFFGALFDVSFRSFITSKLIKVIYILAIVGIGLWSLFLLLAGLASGEPIQILFTLIFVPIVFLLGVIYVRVLLELVIVVFRIGDDMRTLAADVTNRRPGPPQL